VALDSKPFSFKIKFDYSILDNSSLIIPGLYDSTFLKTKVTNTKIYITRCKNHPFPKTVDHVKDSTWSGSKFYDAYGYGIEGSEETDSKLKDSKEITISPTLSKLMPGIAITFEEPEPEDWEPEPIEPPKEGEDHWSDFDFPPSSLP
jgi:hypothetical protein